MGKYFLMSFRFNKNIAEDFGLIESDDVNFAFDPDDNTLWKKCCLYDFGWGKENGFYKMPLPEFNELFNIILYSDNKEDIYGAAAIIMEVYPDLLLERCEEIVFYCSDNKKIMKLASIFKLSDSVNKSPVKGKSFYEILGDYKRWKNIAQYIKENSI